MIANGLNHLMYASYFAPRGRERMYLLGKQLCERYLSPSDSLIGIMGDAGAGKSSLVRGMFPGLELTNDDDGVNIRPLPLLKNIDRGFFTSHTYHVDIRFEMAFTPVYVLADAVKKALAHDKRVIVEHFDLLYPVLQINADVMIGVGGEIIVVRPTPFGPLPSEIISISVKTLKYRKMAHTAEDLTNWILANDYQVKTVFKHRDVHHGFVLETAEILPVRLQEVEEKVRRIIDAGISVSYGDEGHICIGESSWCCSGPRTHVRNTEEIENFRLIPEYKYDAKTKTYLLIGLVGAAQDDLTGFAVLNYVPEI